MALASAQHSDDEYGWDLSLEDEELLSTIADASFATTKPGPGSSSSGGSDSTTRTAPRRATARLKRQTATQGSSLKADIHGAFPQSPSTDTITDLESVADLSPLGPDLPYDRDARLLAEAKRAVARDHGGTGRTLETHCPGFLAQDAPEDVSYPDLTAALGARESTLDERLEQVSGPAEETESDATESRRSPLARFRTYPRKPFSVTDFSSAAWCELQHEFTLTRLGGRKPRTAAMKGGTRVHEKLEREVHRTVRVEIMSREDAFGLKVWNVVQGLRTLRDEGLTRELEVWGLVDGHVVNGLIDGLSTQNPDPDFEEEILSSQGSSQQTNISQQEECHDRKEHRKITDYFVSSGERSPQPRGQLHEKIWLVDVKTRSHWSVPSMTHMRPAMIQLFLYHRFLSEMAAGKLDFLHVYRRYGLDPDERFSDLFLAQIAGLHDEVFHDTSSTPVSPSSHREDNAQPSKAGASSKSDDLLRYRTLRQLTALLKNELRQTFPHGADSIGPIVTIEYRFRGKEPVAPTDNASGADAAIENGARRKARKSREHLLDVGALISQQNIHVDNAKLDAWMATHMEWWRGERAAKGVPIEEADKCRHCQFADDCEWRAENHRRAVARTMDNKAADILLAHKRKWVKYA